MSSVNISIPFWARALSGTAALLSAAVLVWYFLQLALAEVSAMQVVFIAPIAATIFAAYTAIAGRIPKALLPKHTDGQHA